MFFSTRPLNVVPFTQHDEVVQAGIAAGAAGRGLSNTDVGRALLAGIEQFEPREYSGSRIILLVSDGGTFHDAAEIQRRIRAGLQRNRISLYWIHLKSLQQSGARLPGARQRTRTRSSAASLLQTLRTPYQVYEAEAREDLARAVADVGRQQNFPLDYVEQVPRAEYSRGFIAVAGVRLLRAACRTHAVAEELAVRRRTVHIAFGAAALAFAALRHRRRTHGFAKRSA